MTAAILGTATVLAISLNACAFVFPDAMKAMASPLVVALIILSMLKMLVEASLFAHLRQAQMTSLKKSATLMIQPLKKWTVQRFIYGMLGGVLMPALLLAAGHYLTVPGVLLWVWMMVCVTIAGEMMERYLFFRAVIPLQMPH